MKDTATQLNQQTPIETQPDRYASLEEAIRRTQASEQAIEEQIAADLGNDDEHDSSSDERSDFEQRFIPPDAPVYQEGARTETMEQREARLSGQPVTKVLAVPSSRDWPEDFNHENGNYHNRCTSCNEMFIGHKRRMTCKQCARTAASPPAETDEALLAAMEQPVTEPQHILNGNCFDDVLSSLKHCTYHYNYRQGGYYPRGLCAECIACLACGTDRILSNEESAATQSAPCNGTMIPKEWDYDAHATYWECDMCDLGAFNPASPHARPPALVPQQPSHIWIDPLESTDADTTTAGYARHHYDGAIEYVRVPHHAEQPVESASIQIDPLSDRGFSEALAKAEALHCPFCNGEPECDYRYSPGRIPVAKCRRSDCAAGKVYVSLEQWDRRAGQPPIASVDPQSLSAERCAEILNVSKFRGVADWAVRPSGKMLDSQERHAQRYTPLYRAVLLADAQTIAAYLLKHGEVGGGK